MGSKSQPDEFNGHPADGQPPEPAVNEFAPPAMRVDEPLPVAAPQPATLADQLLHRMVAEGESFWSVAYEPFIARDLRRDELRVLISKGLEQTRGSYRALTRLFNMTADDYRRFLNFLRRHDCLPPFQTFREGSTRRTRLRGTRAGFKP